MKLRLGLICLWLTTGPLMAQTLVEQARQAALAGRWLQAVTSYRQALQEQPNAPELWNNLGLALRKNGNPSEAVRAYQKALALRPEFSDAYNNLSALQAESGDLSGALQSATKAAQLDPQNPLALLNVAFLQEQLGSWKQAVVTYRRYTDNFGEQARVRYRLAVCYKQLDKLEDARWNLERALNQDPQNQDYRLALGRLSYQLGDSSLALKYLGNSLDATDPESLHLLGRLAYQAGKFPEAAQSLAKVAPTGDPQLLNDLGAALAKTERLPEAAQFLTQALALKPDYAQAWNNLGLVHKRQGEVPQALSSYRKALELDPSLATARNNLGSLLLEQQQYPEALAQLQQAVTLTPEYWEAQRNLTLAYALNGNLALAETQGAKTITFALTPAEFIQSNNDLAQIQELQQAVHAPKRSVRRS